MQRFIGLGGRSDDRAKADGAIWWVRSSGCDEVGGLLW
jgi:hypothetical protein